MTPDQLAKSNSEHAHQRALFAWANVAARYGFDAAWDDRSYNEAGYAEKTYGTASAAQDLERMHAIANGGSRGDNAKSKMIRGAQLKAEGVKKGVPDIFLPIPMRMGGPNRWDKRYCGLYIEMKRPKAGKQAAGSTSDEQDHWIVYLRSSGYAVGVYFDWRLAAKDIQSYYESCKANDNETKAKAA